MKKAMEFLIAFVLATSAASAHAGCVVSTEQGATTRVVNPTSRADADLIVSMSMMPKLMHLNYRAAAQRPLCDLGPIGSDGAYKLWGSEAPSRERKAMPTKKGGPIAMLVPVFDVMKAIDSTKTGVAGPTEGYMLATISRADLTGWLFYTAMPDVTRMKRDMAQALAGDGTPIFRNSASGKTELFVHKN